MVYLIPAAAYLLREAFQQGEIDIYRAMDYGVYDLLKWATAPAIVVSEEDAVDPDAETAKRGVYGEALYDEYYFTDLIREALERDDRTAFLSYTGDGEDISLCLQQRDAQQQ